MKTKAGLAVAAVLTLLGTGSATATSVSLPAGSSRTVPSTTSATEPDLAAVSISYEVAVPFKIRNAAGAVVCAGYLQSSVSKSASTGRLHFYYRVFNTQGPGAVKRIAMSGFAKLPLRVANRTDGSGTVRAVKARRSSGTGDTVLFGFEPISCARHQDSLFVLIKTPQWLAWWGGVTKITATSGDSELVYGGYRPRY